MNKRRLVTDRVGGSLLSEGTSRFMDFVAGKVLLPLLMVGPLLLLGFTVYDSYEHSAALREVCTTLGGVYIDDHTCVAGKNLFGGK